MVILNLASTSLEINSLQPSYYDENAQLAILPNPSYISIYSVLRTNESTEAGQCKG